MNERVREKVRAKKKETDSRTKRFPFSFPPTDKPPEENMCQCENVITFQKQVTDKLKNLLQNNILFSAIAR